MVLLGCARATTSKQAITLPRSIKKPRIVGGLSANLDRPVKQARDASVIRRRLRPVSRTTSPLLVGTLLALFAAISFGVTTPVLQRFSQALGPFSAAALLYAGAALSAVAIRVTTRANDAPLRREHLTTLLGVAVLGGAVAPVLLTWGLARSGATIGSLVLNFEAVFTVLLARAVYQEPIGRRVWVAMACMAIGGVLLATDVLRSGDWSAFGALAISGATLAWALDNTLTRRLADQDPVEVVGWKGAVGAALTGGMALASREPSPEPIAVWVLLACGATGYGLSLRLYLLAQRRVGAARTGSVFAIAPFVGAALAWALGDRSAGLPTLFAVGCFGLGVYLHVTERHGHHHVHTSMEHEHSHRHDDGHHAHTHEAYVGGSHSHAHRHDTLAHEHDHAPDLHHSHAHGSTERGPS